MTTTITFSVLRNDWHWPVADASTCIDTTGYAPQAIGGGVRLELATGGTGYCWGTDRFVVGRADIRVQDYTGPALDVFLPSSTVAAIRRVFPLPTRRQTDSLLEFSFDPGESKANATPAQLKATARRRGGYDRNATITVTTPEPIDGEALRADLPCQINPDYPDLARFLQGFEGVQAERMAIAFNLQLVAKFQKVRAAKLGAHVRLDMPASPAHPARVQIGDQFTGLIMPARIR